MAVFLLVVVALGVGTLASHWPFWNRAWQWQQAENGWPESLPGPTRVLRGGRTALSIDLEADATLTGIAGSASTRLLLQAGANGRGSAAFAAGESVESMVDGRGLAAGLLAPLYGILGRSHPGLLDMPLGAYLSKWRGMPRGAVTPRQLLWQMSGFPAGPFRPLNPANLRAQLASGPDFERAALHWQPNYPPGSHFEPSPVNAQLLALLAARLDATPYAQLLEQRLWSQFAAGDAVVLLDRPRGDIAAHCCMTAAAADWLRLGLLLASDGRIGARQLLPSGLVAAMTEDSPVHAGFGLGYRLAADSSGGRILILETTGRQLLISPTARRAVLWVGEGAPPALHRLLALLQAGAVTAR
ncbi:MAG: serine hydrolase [Steroidobacteraceae bacterium]